VSTGLNDLPDVLKSVRTKPMFVMGLNVRPLLIFGATPGAYRRVGVVPGGSFEGERLSGAVLDGASDWQIVRNDGSTTRNARLVLKTEDGDLIGMTYQGLHHGPPDIIARIEKGEVVDPASYYFRINPLFETAAAKLRLDQSRNRRRSSLRPRSGVQHLRGIVPLWCLCRNRRRDPERRWKSRLTCRGSPTLVAGGQRPVRWGINA
jgi:hypothetical protein